MANENEVRTTVRFPSDLHMKMRLMLVKNGMSINEYIVKLVENDMNLDLRGISFDERLKR